VGDEAVKTHCIVVNLANVAAVAKSGGAAEDSIDMCSVKGNEAFNVCRFRRRRLCRRRGSTVDDAITTRLRHRRR